ncbi:MAG: bifunctional diaminohydroxyphosphoribosylaminopyrimidine deaminase/5-amino-6-(5-phosphoribosylamino)uracil reductase RibD [Bacteroidales bacterium]|nr:bifunctional diaminohydroxyphosphoribosylaminopyrimidine deaminase/5-amino-6-(5-phosphoribosylamino)uracil reductase RibD [Bacteroidales bacterium]
MSDDEKFMKRAAALAKKGMGWVNPNPLVGALIVNNGHIIGEGYHEFFGGPHAEVNAIGSVLPENKSLLADSTLYVTLEPCSHQGKTPPCTDLIVDKGIRHVVIGMTDPNPIVNGKGIKSLQAHGIAVEVGCLEKEIRTQNEIFVKYITTKLPFVVLKSAMTLDGKIATVTNASRWITGEPSRKLVHQMRQQLSAVMVGVNTVKFDDPILNIRLNKITAQGRKNPLKIIVDTHGRIPLEAKVLSNDPQLTVLATTALANTEKLKSIERLGAQVLLCPVKHNRVDLGFLMQSLGAMDIDSVMIEGGSTLAFSAFQEGIVDKVVSFIAPKILGGADAPTAVGGAGFEKMDEAIPLKNIRIKKIGQDVMIIGLIDFVHDHKVIYHS